MSDSVVDQGLEILVVGQDFTALRRALFATIAGHYLESESSAAPQSDQENYRVLALNALLARLPTRSLASVATITKGKTGIKDAVPGPFPLVVTAEARGSSDHFDFEGPGVMIPMVSSTGHGDASLKRVHFQDGQYAVGSILAVVQPKDTQQLSARYLHAYLSTFKDELLVSRMVGTANVSLTVAKIGDVPVPLLPITAQRKVDELMALCDRMEARQADAESAHAQLVQALLDSLTQASNTTEFASNWQRLAEHFHTLFTTEPSIDALRPTMIDLAIRGTLTRSTPLTTCEASSSSLAKPELKPYRIDSSWKWYRMDEVVIFQGGSQPPKSTFVYKPQPGYTRLIQIRDFKSDLNQTFIPSERANRLFNIDDVMIGRYGPPVFQILRGLSGSYNVALMKASPISPELSKDFLFWLLQERRIHNTVVGESERTAGQTGIRLPLLNSFIVAIPHLSEQARIVAKIDELMAFCDQLKASLAQACRLNEQLASTLVEQAVA